jgi:hypothetical protein
MALGLAGAAHAQSGALLSHPAGSPYFVTPDGHAQFLFGSHTWSNNQSFSGAAGTPTNFANYLTYLQGTEGANFIRYWIWAGVTNNSPAGSGTVSPWPFIQTSGKWNLSSFNQSYFDKVAADADAAKAKGIYLSVMLFFDYDPTGTYGWATSVWNGNNNVNGTTTSNLLVEQSDPTTLALQEAYVAKMLDTLGAKTNVLYEITNEGHNDTTTAAWQSTIIDFIHAYQTSHGYLKQPVGMSALIPTGSSSSLLGTNADWFAPSESTYISNPPNATGAKVALVDTDHVFGIGGDGNWPWRQLTRGQGGTLIMDDMRGTGLTGMLNLGTQYQAIETTERLSLKAISTALTLVNITTMRSDQTLATTGFALADAPSGQFVVLAPTGGTFTVNLSAASGKTLQSTWVNVTTGSFTTSSTLSGGSSAQSFTSPSSDAVLILAPTSSTPIVHNACVSGQ